jgi:phospho-N-acetylmuramoyl-pentapeptide-transferase
MILPAMLHWLLHRYGETLDRLEWVSGETRVYLTARTALATATSFLVAWLFGPIAIRWLKRNFQERVDSASARLNELHAAKNATPTMGGMFIVAAIVAAGALWGDLSNAYVQQALFVVITFGVLGGIDDWVKIRTTKRGLTARQKFLGQCVLGVIVCVWLYQTQSTRQHGLDLIGPFGRYALPLGMAFIAWAAFVLVGASNGVNLTDGLDGLAGCCLIFAASAFTALSYLSGHKVMAEYLNIPHFTGAGELGVLFGAMIGAMLGFLWYNCHPAEVFMGDTGSLPAGALLGYGALVLRQEALLVLIGGVFVVETLSVILQVSWFKWTKRRILLCSPLHNHFLFRGDHEMKIVVRFWISAALLALLAIASLKLR